MAYNRVFFENQKDIIIETLKVAKHDIIIAVAWINFNEYGDTINYLLKNKIHVKIIVNDDHINKRYENWIMNLKENGLKFKMISTPNRFHYMHHKFCIIDKKICIVGSFNWTKNANIYNFEDLAIICDEALANDYISQFNTIWSLSKDDFIKLKKPKCCKKCKQPEAYLCVFSEEGYDQTKADIYKICGCNDLKLINNEFFDASVYNNLMEILEKYSNIDENNWMNEVDKQKYKRMLDCKISNYLSQVRKNRMNCPILHAVGIYACKPLYKNDSENTIQVLWKERYSSNYVMDEYMIDGDRWIKYM